jgi:hypothetical protein
MDMAAVNQNLNRGFYDPPPPATAMLFSRQRIGGGGGLLLDASRPVL